MSAIRVGISQHERAEAQPLPPEQRQEGLSVELGRPVSDHKEVESPALQQGNAFLDVPRRGRAETCILKHALQSDKQIVIEVEDKNSFWPIHNPPEQEW